MSLLRPGGRRSIGAPIINCCEVSVARKLAARGVAATVFPMYVNTDDLVIVERRQDVRIIVSVPGYYTLGDHRNARGERRSYPCRAVNVSTQAIALSAPVIGHIGERTFATIDHLGKFKGSVARQLESGFVMSIIATDEEREKLAAKIGWLEQFKNLDVSDQRGDSRFVPVKPQSRIVFSGGATEDCFVLDLSVSGAAISTETIPKVGTVLALTQIVARVVRHFEGGFAVQFIERQNPKYLEAQLSLDPSDYLRAVLADRPTSAARQFPQS